MYCLDESDVHGNPLNLTLYGNEVSQMFRGLSILFRPCIPRQINDFNKEHGKCLINDAKDLKQLENKLDESTAYVGSAKLIMLYNFEWFDPSAYHDKTIKR